MVFNRRGGAPKKKTLMSEFQDDIKTLCEADNAYETFLATYGKLVTAAKTRDETIVHLIEKKCTNVYIPLILSKENYKTHEAIEAIARLNPTLEGFTEDQIDKYYEKDTPYKQKAQTFINISIYSIKDHPERKKEDYTPFICTTMHYIHYPEFIREIPRFADYSTFLEILDCWIKEYSVNGKIKDDGVFSYLSLVKKVLPEYQEAVLEKLMSVIVLSPKHAIIEPWDKKEFDNVFNVRTDLNFTDNDLTTYLQTNVPLISYIETLVDFIKYFMDQQNVKLLKYIAKHLPLKNDSKFVEIINDLSNVKEYESVNKHLFQITLWRNAQLVKQFLDTYYKFKPIAIKKQDDPFLDIIGKETVFGADIAKFLDAAYPVHRMAIIKRSMKEISDEWKLHRDDYIKMVNSVDKFGLTPMAYAILFQNIEAIKFFTTTTPSLLKQKTTIGKARIDYSVSISVLKDGFTIEDLIKVYGKGDIGKFFETKKDIEARWRTNVIKGYHQTNQETATIIRNTPSNEFWFLAGTAGMFGAGIYFAKTPKETEAKAHEHGIILEADVLLGIPLNLTSHEERDIFYDTYGSLSVDMLYHTLLRNGYDSVVALKDERSNAELKHLKIGRFMQTGNEYMVYNTEQAIFTKIVPRASRSRLLGGTNQRHPISIPQWLVAVQKGDMAALKKLPKGAYSEHWLLNSTPLMVACARGHTDIVKWLLEEVGVSINAKDLLNRNAIFYAMRGGNKHIVQYLITKGAHLLEKDADGKYAVEYFNARPLEKVIDLHKAAAAKRVSVSVGYREVLLKELVRMGDPAMEAVLKYFKNTMRPMSGDMKEKFVAYFSVRTPVRAAVPEPWMGVMPVRKEQAVYGGGRKRSGKK